MNSLSIIDETAAQNAPEALTDSSLESELDQINELLREAANLNFPILNSLLKAIISAGGKRLRPMMALLAARLPGQMDQTDPHKLHQVAAAVEMLHTASLVHDDTIDEALLRRGAATLNSKLSGGAVI